MRYNKDTVQMVQTMTHQTKHLICFVAFFISKHSSFLILEHNRLNIGDTETNKRNLFSTISCDIIILTQFSDDSLCIGSSHCYYTTSHLQHQNSFL